MFIDKAKIFVKSGNGGNGSISFRREKFAPLGGPDGGDGGRGGSVIIVADRNMSTLLDFTYKRKYVADPGDNGAGQKCYGKAGKDLMIHVPIGTIIREAVSNKVIVDIAKEGDTFVICKGGKGGKGNVKFCTPTRQAPEFAEPGMPGEEYQLILELKLIADVGLIGFPNVGKSSLLSKVSNATPKIENYHFTTLSPNLGVVRQKGIGEFVIADIPGIIEGASEGVGLGLEFLRHIERTRMLVHIVDISGIEGRDPYDDFIKINEELKAYSEKLSKRKQLVVANKMDLLYDKSVYDEFAAKIKALGYENVFAMSAATTDGVQEVMKKCYEILSEIPKTDLVISEEELYIPEEKRFTYEIQKGDGLFEITGSFVDRLFDAVNIHNADSMRYFMRVLKNKGVIEELKEMGIKDGDIVRLNDFEFEYLV